MMVKKTKKNRRSKLKKTSSRNKRKKKFKLKRSQSRLKKMLNQPESSKKWRQRSRCLKINKLISLLKRRDFKAYLKLLVSRRMEMILMP